MNSTDIYSLQFNEEEVDFVLPRSRAIHKPFMWYNTLNVSSMKIDNIWLATIAGIKYCYVILYITYYIMIYMCYVVLMYRRSCLIRRISGNGCVPRTFTSK